MFFMRVIIVSLLLLTFFVGLVSAQTVSEPVNPSSDFEKMVVKEHFVTKKEVKDHIDKKVLEYQRTTEEQLVKSFAEVEYIINSKINKFVFKLVLGILGVMVFSGSLWYFVRKKLDRRYDKIKALKNEPKEPSKEESEVLSKIEGGLGSNNIKPVESVVKTVVSEKPVDDSELLKAQLKDEYARLSNDIRKYNDKHKDLSGSDARE